MRVLCNMYMQCSDGGRANTRCPTRQAWALWLGSQLKSRPINGNSAARGDRAALAPCTISWLYES